MLSKKLLFMLLLILYNILYIVLYCHIFYCITYCIFQNSNINNCIVEKKIWQYKNNDIFPCPA